MMYTVEIPLIGNYTEEDVERATIEAKWRIAKGVSDEFCDGVKRLIQIEIETPTKEDKERYMHNLNYGAIDSFTIEPRVRGVVNVGHVEERVYVAPELIVSAIVPLRHESTKNIMTELLKRPFRNFTKAKVDADIKRFNKS